MKKPVPVHVYPLGQEPDIEHPVETVLYQRYFEPACWACQQGLCWQEIEVLDDGSPSVVIHGVRTAS